MPHVIVKMYPGRSEEQKSELTERITRAVIESLDVKESTISVAIEEISPDQWPERVYKPDILEGKGTIYKQPGYDPFKI